MKGRKPAPTHAPRARQAPAQALAQRLNKTIVLVGLMGAGKSCVGKRLAACLGLPFVDADREIEAAAGCCRSPTSSQRMARRRSATASGG